MRPPKPKELVKMQAKILCIEGSHAGSPSFVPALRKKGYRVQSVTTGKAAAKLLDEDTPHVVVVNAASLRTSGTRIVQSLRAQIESLPIILICSEGTPQPEDAPANTILSLPFTIRKLDNRIKPLLPIQSDQVIRVGVIQLDKERLMLRCQGKETRLTPRMARLLELLMQKPGEVIERNHLFRKVWETDFTDDTRTLDVHISWLRQAIEVDPRRPRYLKTLRGVGYRLDV
jgi:DNA-binding response OmpR family regulator